MPWPFSKKRATPEPDTYKHSFSEQVRTRLLLAFKDIAEIGYGHGDRFRSLLSDVEHQLLRKHGTLYRSDSSRHSEVLAIEHFYSCPDRLVPDFIQACFRSQHYTGRQVGVDEINRILREERIGYEFSPYVERELDQPSERKGLSQLAPMLPFARSGNVKYIEVDYPEVIEKRAEYLHDQTIKPCLVVLSAPMFKVANSEMLKAHEYIRKGHLDDALTRAGAAYESVLKTICDKKGWSYSPGSTCGPLVDICAKEDLFPGFYVEVMKAPGVIRNKLSSAHGRGPTPAHDLLITHVDHMLQVTSANIVLLVKLAGL